jgi:hypothetical protein
MIFTQDKCSKFNYLYFRINYGKKLGINII